MTKGRKLLIGYDGSACADRAIDDLRRAGLPTTGEAIVLSVADVGYGPSGEVSLPTAPLAGSHAVREAQAAVLQALNDAYALATHATQRVQTCLPAWNVQAQACANSPVWGLILKAEAWELDTIVVGSHGHAPIERLVLGSVSQGVVTHAHCSVRVARERGAEPGRPQRILVGVDGSPQAEAAVQRVAARCWPANSDARLITALDPMLLTLVAHPAPSILRWLEPHDQEPYAWVHRMVAAAAQTLAATGLAVSTLVQTGDPKRLLVEEAERWGADCVFVGARGLTGLQRIVLGSVSAAVAARAPCSVEVVRSISGDHERPAAIG